MLNLHLSYDEVMDTPFRPMSMILMAMSELMNEGSQVQQPRDMSSNPTWAQNIIEQVQKEHGLI